MEGSVRRATYVGKIDYYYFTTLDERINNGRESKHRMETKLER